MFDGNLLLNLYVRLSISDVTPHFIYQQENWMHGGLTL